MRKTYHLVKQDGGLWTLFFGDEQETSSCGIGSIHSAYDQQDCNRGEFDVLTGWDGCVPCGLIGRTETLSTARAMLIAWHEGGRVGEMTLPYPDWFKGCKCPSCGARHEKRESCPAGCVPPLSPIEEGHLRAEIGQLKRQVILIEDQLSKERAKANQLRDVIEDIRKDLRDHAEPG